MYTKKIRLLNLKYIFILLHRQKLAPFFTLFYPRWGKKSKKMSFYPGPRGNFYPRVTLSYHYPSNRRIVVTFLLRGNKKGNNFGGNFYPFLPLSVQSTDSGNNCTTG